jgi:hypothetical protein
MEVEGLERIKAINHFNYTEEQLAEKELCLKQLAIIYPNVNRYYAELTYDMCKNTSDEQMEILKKKALEPFKYKDRYKNLQEELDNQPKIYIEELVVSQSKMVNDVSGNIESGGRPRTP